MKNYKLKKTLRKSNMEACVTSTLDLPSDLFLGMSHFQYGNCFESAHKIYQVALYKLVRGILGLLSDEGSAAINTFACRATKRIQGLRGKKQRRGPLGEKRAENFQSQEINFGKLLLVYFMSPHPQTLKHCDLWGSGRTLINHEALRHSPNLSIPLFLN